MVLQGAGCRSVEDLRRSVTMAHALCIWGVSRSVFFLNITVEKAVCGTTDFRLCVAVWHITGMMVDQWVIGMYNIAKAKGILFLKLSQLLLADPGCFSVICFIESSPLIYLRHSSNKASFLCKKCADVLMQDFISEFF